MRRSLEFACCLWLLAGVAFAAPAPADKLKNTLSTLEARKQAQAKLERELEQARNELGDMRSRAAKLATSLQASEAKAGKAERALDAVSAELSAKEKEFAVRKREYAHTVMALMRMRQMPPTAMFAPAEDIGAMLRSSRVLDSTNRALAERADMLKKDLARIAMLRRDAVTRKANVARERTALHEQSKKLAADVTARQLLQEKLIRDRSQSQNEIAKLSRESASLQELIGKLERNSTRPQFVERSAADTRRIELGRAKGRLKLPVVGTLQHGFGERKNANETYRGMVLGTRPGALVVAPYDAQVAFTGPFMDYGRMVLLKHGNGHITLLAGLGSISVTLNQQLSTGEPVGSMPGASPSLYLELRERSKPIDPAPWFANVPSRLASRRAPL